MEEFAQQNGGANALAGGWDPDARAQGKLVAPGQ